MISNVFAVYDSKAAAYLPPFFCRNAGVALRSFEAAAKDASHDFNKYAADYTLFHIGSFDEVNGVLIPLGANVNLGCAIQFCSSN